MRAFSNLFIENKALMIAAAAIAFFVAAVLILLVFRLAFGRRLRMANSRARQMRLGIVDAFDLDRQRQLVIIRRDNVEHLVMIGGPNDILIESQIIRTEARSRDKTERELTAPPAKSQSGEPKLGPPMREEPQPAAAAFDDHPPTAPRAPAAPVAPLAGLTAGPRRSTPKATPTPQPAPAPVTPPAPIPAAPGPLPELPPAPAAKSASPRATPGPAIPPLPAAAGPAVPAAVTPPVTAAPVVPPPTSGEPPDFLRWPQQKAAVPPAATSRPVKAPGGAPPLPTPRPKQPAATPTPVAPELPAGGPPVPSMEGLESLEEEMAKLLGRGPNKP